MAACSLRVTKNAFSVLGQWVREPATQVIFSFILPVEDSNIGRNRQIDTTAGVTAKMLGSATMERLMQHQACWHQIFLREGRAFLHGNTSVSLAELHVLGQRDNIRLIPGQLQDERQRLEGQGANKGSLLLTLKPQSTDHADTHLQFYGDEPGTHEVTGANRETAENDLTGSKWCTCRETTWPVAQLKCLYSRACSVDNK